MAKICILEDCLDDIISRYSQLTQTPHDVHVVLNFSWGKSEGRVNNANKELSEAGFKLSNVIYEDVYIRPEHVPSDATVYFCDGLEGRCFSLAERLGKERVYINTDDLGLEIKAKQGGFRIADRSIKDIVSKLSEK